METGNGTIAPLRNVALFIELVDRVMNRPAHLPGMATFHGFSGYGKTFSATYAANKWRARYIEVGASWTRKKMCEALLVELGETVKGTISSMVDTIIEALAIANVPLIIDEFDHVVSMGEKAVNLVREIHDKSEASIILIGEENLPNTLSRWERMHNRMLDWVPAQPADADDTAHLARLYCPDLEIAPDLLGRIADKSAGRVRRICVNLERVREHARMNGLDSIGLAEWGDQSLFTGKPPVRRAA